MYIRQVIRDIINVMVIDIVSNLKINIKNYNVKKINDVYKLDNQIVLFSDKMNDFDKQIKEFLKVNMYLSKTVLQKTNYGKKVIESLFYKIQKNPKKYLNKKFTKKNSYSDRSVCDFIAGMTDRYAINLYKSIK